MKGFRVVLLVAVVVGASCGARRADAPAVELDATTVVSVLSPPLAAPTLVAQAPPTSVAAMSELAALVRFLGSAEYDAAEHAAAPQPVAVTIEALAVIEAPVLPVGVTASGELDVPGPDIVGWYEFGPSPRETGTTVLAAHVNFNGIDGVFRNLRKLEAGSFIDVRLADRSTQRYLATDVGLFDKDELPTSRVWNRTGRPGLVLFTCGGRFNASLRSFEDNVLAFAIPI